MPVIFSWFSNSNPSNPQSPNSYVKISGIPTCPGNSVVCAIYAQVDANNKPIITTDLDAEITTALNLPGDTENVWLRSN